MGGLGLLLIAIPAVGAAPDGPALYATHCSVCHQPDGGGISGLAPPLRSALWQKLGRRAPMYLTSVLVTGMVGVPLDGQRYGAGMPAWSHLTDAEIAAIGSYVLQKLNGAKVVVTAKEVAEKRAATLDNAALRTLREGS